MGLRITYWERVLIDFKELQYILNKPQNVLIYVRIDSATQAKPTRALINLAALSISEGNVSFLLP